MRTELFDYDLPESLIAQIPLPRGQSRLLVLNRATGEIQHRQFVDLPSLMHPGDTLVVNDTRVSARRLVAVRDNGAQAEVLLMYPCGDTGWHALVNPGRALKPGRQIRLLGPDGAGVIATVTATTDDGGRLLELPDQLWRDRISTWGHTPLPPYIGPQLSATEEERYQTIYSIGSGSAAAPTAGLHFTPELFTALSKRGVERTAITLHVGVGTFRPVKTDDIEAHDMHAETVTVPHSAAEIINRSSGRIIAVGTTTTRALESSTCSEYNSELTGADFDARVAPFHGASRLFIKPGYKFRAIDGLITNFHQPRSTLLMMISAFAGRELIMHAYSEAIKEEYRFLSFGDAMMIV